MTFPYSGRSLWVYPVCECRNFVIISLPASTISSCLVFFCSLEFLTKGNSFDFPLNLIDVNHYIDRLRELVGQFHPTAQTATEYRLSIHIALPLFIYIVGIDRLIKPVKIFAWIFQ